MEPIVTLFWRTWSVLGHVGQALWHFPWRYLIDIGIMTFIVYQTYIRFRDTRAMRILSGIAVLGLGYLVAQAAGLFLTSWLLGGVWAAALIFVIVIFQGEIRQVLEQVNPREIRQMLEQVNLSLPLAMLLRRASQATLPGESLVPIVEAAFALASRRHGALLILERHDLPEPLLKSPGVVIDAGISSELLETLFAPSTPLHDGALYIRRGRAYRAGCVLPLSENRTLGFFYGTRHRAAIDLRDANSGWHRYPISGEQINIPPGLQLTRVTPSEIRLHLRAKPSGDHLR